MHLPSISRLLILIALFLISGESSEYPPPINKGAESMARAVQSGLNPLGEVWQSASRMLGKGLHKFRESLHEGVKVARLLKDDVDEGVTKLMNTKPSTHTSQPEPTDEQQLLREGVLGGLLKLMGVNSNQLGVVALNVLIIVAEWITSSFMGSNENARATSRMVKDNLLEWVVKGSNPKVENILRQAKNHSLPENIIKALEAKTGNSTACVQLLICKMSPVIWGVQKTVKQSLNNFNNTETGKSTDSTIMESLLKHLPPKNVFVNFGDHCEKRFPYCKLLKFSPTA